MSEFALTFNDISLVPQYSEVKSRKEPNTSTVLGSFKVEVPIIAAPMNTITEWEMVQKLSELGASSVLHRYMTLDDQFEQCKNAIASGARNFFVAVGASGDYRERVLKLYDTLGITNFCVDVANGHSEICLKAVKELSENSKLNIMAGNVCTWHGAYNLAEAGAKLIRVGVGPGSVCKTRIVTGHGVPQVTAIMECAKIKERFPDVCIIADGGIKNSGDIVKALAVGADAVMIGGLFAGTEETPGEVVFPESLSGPACPMKHYAGMASEKGRKFNGWFSEENASFIPEGESTLVPLRGSVEEVINGLVGGLRSGMSYSGVLSIKDLQESAEWVRITHNGFTEGTPHGIK